MSIAGSIQIVPATSPVRCTGLGESSFCNSGSPRSRHSRSTVRWLL